jgi:hypothetical protein
MKSKFVKKTKFITIIGFTACDKSVLDVNFDTDYSANFDINISPKKNDPGKFYESISLNPKSDPDVNKYWNNIKNITTNGITFRIENTSISENFKLLNDTISIENSDKYAEWVFEKIDVTSDSLSFNLDNNNGQWNTVENIIKDGKEFTIKFTGQSDVDEVNFDAIVTINTEITANPL